MDKRAWIFVALFVGVCALAWLVSFVVGWKMYNVLFHEQMDSNSTFVASWLLGELFLIGTWVVSNLFISHEQYVLAEFERNIIDTHLIKFHIFHTRYFMSSQLKILEEKQASLLVELLRVQEEIQAIQSASGATRLEQATSIKLKWINRIDSDSTHTYAWKVACKRKGSYYHKYFTDGIYGSKDKALAAAITYRDSLVKDLSGADWAIWKRENKRPNNTSGIVGVARYMLGKTRNGRKTSYPYWQAFWLNADGKRVSRTFSVLLHGEEKAKQLACETRKAGLLEVESIINTRRNVQYA